MHARAECPTEARLRALLNGNLRDAEADALTAHLDACPVCRKQLDRLAGGSRSPEDLAARLRLEPDPDSPALREVLDGLRGRGEADPGPTGPPDEDPGDPPTAEVPGDCPRRVGPYQVEGLVGEGGMGRVFKAYDPSLRRVVAIKVMSAPLAARGTARGRFTREARAAGAVTHEHVVTIHGVDQAGGVPYIVMQYVKGKSLQERIDQGAPLPLRETLRIGMQIASGLAAAHAQGVVHRDIKPSNILLENGVERVKITDFGLARVHDDDITASGVISGTPQYMSPEQARGEPVDARSDLFSLGGVLYAMCTGEPPFRGGHPLSVLKRVCENEPRPIRQVNPDVPDWLAAIIARLMAKDPGERFGTAQEVADLLGRHLAHLQQPTSVPMPERVDAPAETKRRAPSASERWGRRLIAAFALATLIGPGCAAVVHGGPPAVWPIGLVSLGAAAVLVNLWAARPTRPRNVPGPRRHFHWNHGLLVLAGLVAVAVGLMLQAAPDVWPTVPIFHVRWRVVLLATPLLLAGVLFATLRRAKQRGHTDRGRGHGFRIVYLLPIFAGFFVVFFGLRHQQGGAFGPDSAYPLVVNVTDPKLTVSIEGGRMQRTEYRFDGKRTLTLHVPPGSYTVKAFKDGEDVYAQSLKLQAGPTVVNIPGSGQVAFSVPDPMLLVVLDGKPVAAGRPHETDLGRHHWLAVKKGTEVVAQGDVVVRAGRRAEVRVGESADRSNDGPWVQLFNGRDLTGWKPHAVQSGYWHVENGAIVGVGGPTYLITERDDFEDFRLRVEARVYGGAAGGVFFRVASDADQTKKPLGYEAPIVDADNATGHGTGSLAGFTKTTGRRVRPGAWFTLEVIAEGDHLVVKFNGETTTDVRDPKRLYRKGHIALQVGNSLSAIEFRRVEVSEAPPTASPPAVRHKETADVLKELVRQREEDFRRARERHQAGAISPVELLASEAELLNASVQLAEAEGRHREALRLLKQIVVKRRQEKELVQLQVEEGYQPQTKLTEVGRKLAEAELKLIDAEKRLPEKGQEAIPPANP